MNTENENASKEAKERERLERRFQELFGHNKDFRQISSRLSEMQFDPDIDALRGMFCNGLLYGFCAGYAKYPEKDTDEEISIKQLFSRNAALLPRTGENAYYASVSCFFQHRYAECMQHLNEFMEYNRSFCEEAPFDERTWADCLLDTFKNAYPGFWDEMSVILKAYPCAPEVVELCTLVGQYYQCSTDDEMINLLLPFAAKHPELSLPKELLGFSYLGKKMWYNAIACFEQVEGSSVLFYACDVTFQIAWCYGKLRNWKAEEQYYRKCLEREPDYPNALNNLGYCLYKQKSYTEAKAIFETCINEKRDLPFAANNYVRVLLMEGQYQTAHDFIGRKNHRVSSELVKRVQQHPPVNEPVSSTVIEEFDDGATVEESLPDFGIKRQQFSSEKVLEDELTARIEGGYEVFGRRLKIYRRSGDFYGRQYPIANGKWRIDLLCEDSEGNPVVIELKKDRGYDDPYEQIRNYIDWIQKNRCGKSQKAYGIICLNAPSEALIERVRKDELVSLFEYQISYREIK